MNMTTPKVADENSSKISAKTFLFFCILILVSCFRVRLNGILFTFRPFRPPDSQILRTRATTDSSTAMGESNEDKGDGPTAAPPTSANLPWVEKYRPAALQELISHEDIIKTIRRFISEEKLPHLLFYGPPGTGKTSTILACAKELYSAKEFNSMVLELNASDDRGINVVRGQILNFASTRTIFNSGFKLVILDEADAMTQDAQNALRRIIEKFTDNVRFCLICNYLSKIIPALQSRCTRFRFGPLDPEQIMPRLVHVCEQESVDVT